MESLINRTKRAIRMSVSHRTPAILDTESIAERVVQPTAWLQHFGKCHINCCLGGHHHLLEACLGLITVGLLLSCACFHLAEAT